MNDVLEKLQTYQLGMIQQVNFINNTIAKKDQDEETRKTIIKINSMISNINRVVKIFEI